jgi:N-acetylglucosamine-6-phosphate deacetylase
VRHLVRAVGTPVATAAGMATRNPAAATGLPGRGTLRAGDRADLLVLDDRLDICSIYSGGQLVPPVRQDARATAGSETEEY